MTLYELGQQFRAQLAAQDEAAQARLVAAYLPIATHLQAKLIALEEAIAEAELRGQVITPAWLAQQERYQTLLEQVATQVGQFGTGTLAQLTAEQQAQAFHLALEHAQETVALDGPSVAGAFNRLPVQAMQHLVGHLGDGTPLSKLLAKTGPATAQSVKQTLLQGLAVGQPLKQTAAQVKQQLNAPLWQAARLVRTETLRAYRAAAHTSSQKNAKLFAGWLWTAAQGQRSCAACLALDGKLFPLEKPMAAHPNCRCVPVLTTWTRWAKEQANPRQTGAEWLKKQPLATQEVVLGKAGAAAYRDGLPLKNWLGTSQSKQWGPHHYQRSLKSALKGPQKSGHPKPFKPVKPLPPTKSVALPVVLPPPAPSVPLAPVPAPPWPPTPPWPRLAMPPPPPVVLPPPPPIIKLVPPPPPPLPVAPSVPPLPVPAKPPKLQPAAAAITRAPIAAAPPPKKKAAPKPKAPPSPLQDPHAVIVWGKTPLHENTKLNGVALSPATPGYWDKIKDVQTGEPPLDPAQKWSTGLVIVEPDGRLWLVEPKNHFGGYQHTYPKGKVEPGLTRQQNALKEAYEEAGLAAEIKGYLGDFKGTTGSTRYYVAKRTGGAPWTAHWESDRVKLVPLEQADKFLNTQRDKDILAALKAKLTAEPNLLKQKLKPVPAVKAPKPPKPKVAPKAKAVKVEPLPVLPPPTGFPTDPHQLELVKKLGGSTGAELVRDPATGKQYVRKRGANADHLREEFTADQAYRALGVHVPAAQLYETATGPIKLAEFIEGQTLGKLTGTARTTADAELRKGFAADALLGNWDVIGLSEDNVLVGTDGRVWRIDNGGSLRFRAQGSQKNSDQWNEHPTDLWSLRELAGNPATKVFKDVNVFEIGRQVRQLQTRRKELLAALPATVRTTVEKRLGHLADVAQIAETFENDQWKDGYTNEFARHVIGLRKSGIVDRLPKQLNNPAGDQYNVTDENGKKFDHLRGANSIVHDLDKYMRAYGTKQSIIADFVSAQAGSSWSPKARAVKGFFVEQRNVADQAYFWRHANLAEAVQERKKWASKVGGEKSITDAVTIYHAFHYELFGKVEMRYNDRQARTLRLIRTEDADILKDKGVKLGPAQRMQRGAHESASIFKKTDAVAGNAVTVQTVPHHRATFAYLLDGTPGKNNTGFLNDRENEVMFLTEGLDFEYLGQGVHPKY